MPSLPTAEINALTIRGILRRPANLGIVAVVTVGLSVLYYYFTLRAAGMDMDSPINVIRFATPEFIISQWGIGTFAASVVLSVVVAALTGVIAAVSVSSYRSSKLGGVCSVGTFGLAMATFTCPGCAVPLTATLGIAIMGTSLPLLGVEFQLASLVLLVGGLVWLSRRMRRAFPVRSSTP